MTTKRFNAMVLAAALASAGTALGAAGTGIVTSTRSHAGTEPEAALIEIAPLRSALGQVSARLEAMPVARLALGLEAAHEQTPGARADVADTRDGYGLEALWYPLGQRDWPFFVGTGMRQTQATIGRTRLRDTQTWARTNADEMTDTWVNRDTYLSWTQTAGYRVLAGGFVTVALRITRDELLSTDRKIDRTDVRSLAPDLTSPGRARVETRLALHAGLYLP